MPTCMHTGWFVSVPLCSGQSEMASICPFVQFNNQLDVYDKEVVLLLASTSSEFKNDFDKTR